MRIFGREEDAILVKTDRWGETEWWRTFGTLSHDKGSSVQQCLDGGFAIAGLISENTYDAWLVKTDENGLIAGVEEGATSDQPRSCRLFQNYPNPFNPRTEIRFWITDYARLPLSNNQGGQGLVTLKVFDLLGREVATLVNEVMPPGEHSARFDATALSSGVYFYRLIAGNFVDTKKLIVTK
jgi:hypothetical protein